MKTRVFEWNAGLKSASVVLKSPASHFGSESGRLLTCHKLSHADTSLSYSSDCLCYKLLPATQLESFNVNNHFPTSTLRTSKMSGFIMNPEKLKKLPKELQKTIALLDTTQLSHIQAAFSK